MILDFSDISEWTASFQYVVESVIPAFVLSDLTTLDHEEMYSDTLEYLTSSYESCGLDTLRELLEAELDECVCKVYQSVKGYHACRVTNENSYKTRGIIGLNQDILFELAVERFLEHTTLTKIKEACEKINISCDENKVFFFPSLENAKNSDQNHYLKCGSETLQELSYDLGLSCSGILSGQGKSCIVECDIPIKQIHPMYRLDIWRILTTYVLQLKNGKQEISKTPDIGYATSCSLDSKYIRKFHYINDNSYAYRLPLH